MWNYSKSNFGLTYKFHSFNRFLLSFGDSYEQCYGIQFSVTIVTISLREETNEKVTEIRKTKEKGRLVYSILT